jgi:hypothetical protein
MFGQIPSLSNVRFRVARFAGEMAMFGRFQPSGRSPDRMSLCGGQRVDGFKDIEQA